MASEQVNRILEAEKKASEIEQEARVKSDEILANAQKQAQKRAFPLHTPITEAAGEPEHRTGDDQVEDQNLPRHVAAEDDPEQEKSNQHRGLFLSTPVRLLRAEAGAYLLNK